MTGPFRCTDLTTEHNHGSGQRGKRSENDPIPDRPRHAVMGVILQQIDVNNSIVTLAVVDKYGDLQAHKDLKHLMPPRKLNQPTNPNLTEEEKQRMKKAKLAH